jgi:hypothetical protein
MRPTHLFPFGQMHVLLLARVAGDRALRRQLDAASDNDKTAMEMPRR